jgi:hypothetical protein
MNMPNMACVMPQYRALEFFYRMLVFIAPAGPQISNSHTPKKSFLARLEFFGRMLEMLLH